MNAPAPAGSYDAIVVGAGPAGLTAALYLARFRRSVLVVHDGRSRASWIPLSRNLAGHPDGVAGSELLRRMEDHARRYGAEIRTGEAMRLSAEDGGLRIETDAGPLRTRGVVLATGVVDVEPTLPGVDAAVRQGLMRLCPICDGYEVIGKRVAIIGDSEHGASETLFVRTFTDRLTLIHVGEPEALPPDRRRQLAHAGVAVVDAPLEAVHLEGEDEGAPRICALTWAGERRDFDSVYAALGSTPRMSLAESAGLAVGPDGRLTVDAHQQTSLGGVYAAGDAVRGLNQIAVALGEAAVAAVALHNRLREADAETGAPSAQTVRA